MDIELFEIELNTLFDKYKISLTKFNMCQTDYNSGIDPRNNLVYGSNEYEITIEGRYKDT